MSLVSPRLCPPRWTFQDRFLGYLRVLSARRPSRCRDKAGSSSSSCQLRDPIGARCTSGPECPWRTPTPTQAGQTRRSFAADFFSGRPRKLFGRLTRPTGIKRRRHRGACKTRYGVDADERSLISRAITQVCSMRGTREGGPPVANPPLRSRRRCAAFVARGGHHSVAVARRAGAGRGSGECAGPAGPAASRLSIEAGVAYTLLRYGSTAPHTGSLCTRPRHMRSAHASGVVLLPSRVAALATLPGHDVVPRIWRRPHAAPSWAPDLGVRYGPPGCAASPSSRVPSTDCDPPLLSSVQTASPPGRP